MVAGALALYAMTAQALPARAHAFGARYDLPLPLNLYLGAAGATVAVSFALMALFLRPRHANHAAGRSWQADVPLPLATTLAAAARALGIALFVLIVAAGLFGEQSATGNLAPTMVWVIWWVGLVFFTVAVGDVWSLINPWDGLFRVWQRLAPARFARLARDDAGCYPRWLGWWPALAVFLVFVWLELIAESAEHPRSLAFLILAYSALTWAAMAGFGRLVWLEHGEGFARIFNILGRFAPLSAGPQTRSAALRLRPYGAGLVSLRPLPASAVFLVIALLAAVSFDGFSETPAWTAVTGWVSESTFLRPILIALQGAGVDLLMLVKTCALLLAIALFATVYSGVIWLSALAGGGAFGFRKLFATLALSLVPIAIAYHIAHYTSFLLLAGQLIIPLASDPFGFGWDLFGTAGHVMDITIVNAKMVWYLAVISIVTGHLIAVHVAHRVALQAYGSVGAALRSQMPMLALMVSYTMTSLWILSQPIVAE